MKTIQKFGIMLALVAIISSTAFGGGFRRSSSHCYYPQRYYAPAYVAPVYQAPKQSIQIQNIYPQGQTIYGGSSLGQVSALYATNPSLSQQLAADNGKHWAEAFKAAVDSGTVTNQAIARIGELNAATQHLKAALGAGSQRGQSSTLTIEQQGGGETTGLALNSCVKCHGVGKKATALDFGRPDQSLRALDILRGQDVPEEMKSFVDGLSADDKGSIMEEILTMWRASK